MDCVSELLFCITVVDLDGKAEGLTLSYRRCRVECAVGEPREV